MTLSAADMAFVRDLFEDLPELTTRRMFGAMGIYVAGTIFAVQLGDGRLLLKAGSPDFAERMSDLGGEEWIYTRKNGTQSAMPYWSMPEAFLDDPEQACALARDALDVLGA